MPDNIKIKIYPEVGKVKNIIYNNQPYIFDNIGIGIKILILI